MVCEPLIDLLPDQPPEAVQDVALVDDQVKVELAPLLTVLGSALNFTRAPSPEPSVTISDCVALPPIPIHVSV
jgi:hypothetical protein